MMMDTRTRLLQGWGRYIARAAQQGALGGKPCSISKIEGIAGPRAGALEIMAGLDAGRLLNALRKNSEAVMRQFIPWAFTGEPVVYMAGRALRIEAGWPRELAESMIRLSDLAPHPKDGGRWVLGKNESGKTVIGGLSDLVPHYLVSGASGSGKSVALRSAVLQLSQDPTNRLLLADGKYGESLRQVQRLQGVVAPVAVDGPSIRAALGWACGQMRARYQEIQNGRQVDSMGRLIVCFDEIQEFATDPVVVSLMSKLAAQGRGCHVGMLLATQHPSVGIFGSPTTRRNLVGKVALRVGDFDASKVAVGGSQPRADRLLGAGDCYAVSPRAVHRLQGCFVDGQDFDQADGGRWLFDQWADLDAEAIGQDLPEQKAGWSYTGSEVALSIVGAREGEGRPALVKRLVAAGMSKPGAERAARLLRLGRDAHGWLEDNGYCLVTCDD